MCKRAEAQFNNIIDKYGKFLSHTVIRLCPKDLGLEFTEVEHEVRLCLRNALQHENKIQDSATFLYRIGLTAALDAVRRIKAKREEQLRLVKAEEKEEEETKTLTGDSGHSPELEAERRQVAGKVRNAVARLPDKRRRAVGLYLEGFSCREIADLLGWSEAEARNLLNRGLRDLRAQLSREGIEYEFDD